MLERLAKIASGVRYPLLMLFFVLYASGVYAQAIIAQAGWTLIFVDREETVRDGPAIAIKSFDGNVNTFWHSQWFNIDPDPPPPHEIRINLGASFGGQPTLDKRYGLIRTSRSEIFKQCIRRTSASRVYSRS